MDDDDDDDDGGAGGGDDDDDDGGAGGGDDDDDGGAGGGDDDDDGVCVSHIILPFAGQNPATGDAPGLRAEGWHHLCRSHLWHESLATGIGSLETIRPGTGGFNGAKKA